MPIYSMDDIRDKLKKNFKGLIHKQIPFKQNTVFFTSIITHYTFLTILDCLKYLLQEDFRFNLQFLTLRIRYKNRIFDYSLKIDEEGKPCLPETTQQVIAHGLLEFSKYYKNEVKLNATYS